MYNDFHIQQPQQRSMADAYGDEEPLDYSVLSVAVMTLGLILFVEVIRHRLDHIAEHRPFFKTVLDATYSECTSHPFGGMILLYLPVLTISTLHFLSLHTRSGYAGDRRTLCLSTAKILRN